MLNSIHYLPFLCNENYFKLNPTPIHYKLDSSLLLMENISQRNLNITIFVTVIKNYILLEAMSCNKMTITSAMTYIVSEIRKEN